MRFCFLDSTADYSVFSPDHHALRGAEKALHGLADALSARGHGVSVACRVSRRVERNGIAYVPAGEATDLVADVSVAFRDPALLGQVSARRQLLWVTASPEYMAHPAVQARILATRAGVLFCGAAQHRRWSGDGPAWIMPVGVRSPFLGRGTGVPASIDPVAVVTTHPQRGLDRLLDIWCDQIRPHVPGARLLVVSRLLGSGPDYVPEALRPLFERVEALASKEVEVCLPPGDLGLATLWSRARLHLYPTCDDDMCCWTLAESQACGVPAVVGPAGGAIDRIENGVSGYSVPDDAALAGVAVQILQDDGVFAGLSAAAGASFRHRSWNDAAVFLETLAAEVCV